MDKKVSEFLEQQRISVLSILQTDGSIHSATLHYASISNPPSFFFMTEKDSKKCASLLEGQVQVASVVIGFSEEEFTTFQAEGKVRIASKEADAEWKTYINKYPTRSKGRENPSYVLLEFTPSWWRYSDTKASPQVKIESSNSYTK